MELNRDQIIKALKWCSELRLCVDCPMRAEGYFSHSGNACRQALMENALALIKELTAENERLRAEVVAKEAEYDDMLHQRDSVEKALETAEVNTARKMMEKIYEYYDRPCYKTTKQHPVRHTDVSFMLSVIGKIAKEILEE